MKFGGSIVNYRHQSRMLNMALDASGKFNLPKMPQLRLGLGLDAINNWGLEAF